MLLLLFGLAAEIVKQSTHLNYCPNFRGRLSKQRCLIIEHYLNAHCFFPERLLWQTRRQEKCAKCFRGCAFRAVNSFESILDFLPDSPIAFSDSTIRATLFYFGHSMQLLQSSRDASLTRYRLPA